MKITLLLFVFLAMANTSLGATTPLENLIIKNAEQLTWQIKQDLFKKTGGFGMGGLKLYTDSLDCRETSPTWPSDSVSGVCIVEVGKMQIYAKYVVNISEGQIVSATHLSHAIE